MTRLIDLVLPILKDSLGGVGGLRLKQEIEKQTGQRFNLQLWDSWLRKLGREGVIIFTDMGHGGVCHHTEDPTCLRRGFTLPRESVLESGSTEEVKQ